MKETKLTFCQSCGLPLVDASMLGTNEDGSPNTEYCIYCYKNGDFTADLTMEEMISTCVPFMLQAHPELTSQEAHDMMRNVLPCLKRWRKQ